MGARIIAVADAFDTITSDRTYKKARSAPDALAVLIEGDSLKRVTAPVGRGGRPRPVGSLPVIVEARQHGETGIQAAAVVLVLRQSAVVRGVHDLGVDTERQPFADGLIEIQPQGLFVGERIGDDSTLVFVHGRGVIPSGFRPATDARVGLVGERLPTKELLLEIVVGVWLVVQRALGAERGLGAGD